MPSFTLGVLLFIFVLTCGTPSPPDEKRHGAYKAYTWVTETKGTCDFVKLQSSLNVSFNNDGDLESPLPGTIACFTSYPLAVYCTGIGAQAYLVLRNNDRGTGVVVGNISGCELIKLDFKLEKQE